MHLINNQSALVMPKMLLFLLFSWIAVPLSGQYGANGLVPFSDSTGQWGYMNAERQVVILPQFDEVGFFDLYLSGDSTSCARVKTAHGYGVINQRGRLVIPPVYDSIPRETILTTTDRYGILFDDGRLRYFLATGEIRDTFEGQRSLVCGFGWGDHCVGLRTIRDLPALPDNPQANFAYTDATIKMVNGRKDWVSTKVEVQLDSLIRMGPNNVQILFRSDGKINIIQFIYQKPHAARGVSTGFLYDEVQFVPCSPPIIGGIYEEILKVRQGEAWGLIDPTWYDGRGFSPKDAESRETLSPRYREILDYTYGYFFVEYAEDRWGYMKLDERGELTEYWIGK